MIVRVVASLLVLGAVALSSACSSEEEASPCQALWNDMCERAAACNSKGTEVAVQRPTKSGGPGVTLSYSDEADCRGGANFCKKDGPIQACKEALSGAECVGSSGGSTAALVLPAACLGID